MNDRKKQRNKEYLVLGDPSKIRSYAKEKKLKSIIRKTQRSKLPGVWGTLGWKNDKPFDLFIGNSRNGNTNPNKRDNSTTNIIQDIAGFNKQIQNIKNDVVERYINLDAAKFDFDWSKVKTFEDIPELRLDLFVEQKQGAMVYYYHQLRRNFRRLDDQSAYEEFIQCEKTENFTTKRDRLKYYFRFLPPNEYNINANGNIEFLPTKRKTSFIIKIITFKRQEGTPKELLKEFFDREKLEINPSSPGSVTTHSLFGKDKYELLIYDSKVQSSSVASSKKERFNMRGAFFAVDAEHKIDRNKKTLLLIHGTFSNTLNTFEELVKLRNRGSELEDFLAIKNYEQVISFNHPTISADVFDNIKVLKQLLGNKKFTKKLSLLAASRGCLLSQAIGADNTLPFTVEKCLMFSPANGVGYFDLGKKIATGLGVLKKVTTGTPAKYIFALLQFSADYFMAQPGARQMKFDSARLKKVTSSQLADAGSKYTAVIDDWEKTLIHSRKKRFWMKIADGIVKLILGRKHDFVVGEKGQINLPEAYHVNKVFMASTHCKYFGKGELKERGGQVVILSVFMSKYL
jgi:hypothetical protein